MSVTNFNKVDEQINPINSTLLPSVYVNTLLNVDIDDVGFN